MRQIKNEDLAQLLMEVRFAPPAQRKKQVDRVEHLLDLIEKDKEYPFEFVCFKITGFRPKGDVGRRLIKGEELADDLRIFIWKLSGQVAPPASQQKEELFTTQQLAKKLNVSTKTIDRWRKRGLGVRKFVFDDRRKRLGFLQSAVDKFLKQNPQLTGKAVQFTRLSPEQKSKIIEQALELSARTKMSRRQIIRKIADETGKGQETIRCVLLNYQNTNPKSGASGLRPTARQLDPAQDADIDRLHRQGAGIAELMDRFNRSRSSIFRILKQRRVQTLLAKKIEFVQSNDFSKPGAEEKILGGQIDSKQPRPKERGIPPSLKGGSLGEYLDGLKDTPNLNRQEEMELFRKYNYLKYLAHNAREQIKTAGSTSALLNEIENYLSAAEAVKKTIIESNLRLVVSIAGRHTITGANLADLVSQGNVSLMHAVEKFDYTKGFRFSTYAGWAISKDFARRIPGQRPPADRPAPELGEFEEQVQPQSVDAAAVERARNDLIQVIRNNLEQREQYIIINHFGLEGTLVKKNKKTLSQIGVDLGLSKERVRQIELEGLQKLRQSLSPELFDLLTG